MRTDDAEQERLARHHAKSAKAQEIRQNEEVDPTAGSRLPQGFPFAAALGGYRCDTLQQGRFGFNSNGLSVDALLRKPEVTGAMLRGNMAVERARIPVRRFFGPINST